MMAVDGGAELARLAQRPLGQRVPLDAGAAPATVQMIMDAMNFEEMFEFGVPNSRSSYNLGLTGRLQKIVDVVKNVFEESAPGHDFRELPERRGPAVHEEEGRRPPHRPRHPVPLGWQPRPADW